MQMESSFVYIFLLFVYECLSYCLFKMADGVNVLDLVLKTLRLC